MNNVCIALANLAKRKYTVYKFFEKQPSIEIVVKVAL